MNQNSGEATKLGQAPPKKKIQCIWRASYEAESILYKWWGNPIYTSLLFSCFPQGIKYIKLILNQLVVFHKMPLEWGVPEICSHPRERVPQNDHLGWNIYSENIIHPKCSQNDYKQAFLGSALSWSFFREHSNGVTLLHNKPKLTKWNPY